MAKCAPDVLASPARTVGNFGNLVANPPKFRAPTGSLRDNANACTTLVRSWRTPLGRCPPTGHGASPTSADGRGASRFVPGARETARTASPPRSGPCVDDVPQAPLPHEGPHGPSPLSPTLGRGALVATLRARPPPLSASPPGRVRLQHFTMYHSAAWTCLPQLSGTRELGPGPGPGPESPAPEARAQAHTQSMVGPPCDSGASTDRLEQAQPSRRETACAASYA